MSGREDIPLDPPSQAKGEAEAIMDCEVCGRIDHHCVRGVCPECRERFHPDRFAYALERRRESIRAKQRRRDDDALAQTLFVSGRLQ